jgi:hypothetical protein
VGGYDICVTNDSDGNVSSCTNFSSYANGTTFDPNKFFTGARNFQVREIEVFQITD